MTCSACDIGEIRYEIRLKGETNRNNWTAIWAYMRGRDAAIDGDSGRDAAIDERSGRFRTDEAGAVDFADYCRDHLDLESAEYRTDASGAWQPLARLEAALGARWIDDVIRQEAVVCYYQPIVTAEGALYAYEMLARFPDGSGGMRMPGEVFAAAKLRGRLYALDRLCRMTAVRSAAALGTRAFINFIPTSIYSPEHCLRSTVALAAELGADPANFVFEVVESEQVDDTEHLKRILAYYRSRGFRYALDDVGEGYSTVEALVDLQPHYMKLDMKFVRGVANDPAKQAAAQNFLAVASRIGSVPLAEGVEAPEDYDWLLGTGYELFQGYLFGKPAPSPALRIFPSFE